MSVFFYKALILTCCLFSVSCNKKDSISKCLDRYQGIDFKRLHHNGYNKSLVVRGTREDTMIFLVGLHNLECEKTLWVYMNYEKDSIYSVKDNITLKSVECSYMPLDSIAAVAFIEFALSENIVLIEIDSMNNIFFKGKDCSNFLFKKSDTYVGKPDTLVFKHLKGLWYVKK